MTTEKLITKAEKWLKDETGNNCSNLSVKQATRAMAYFHQHLLQQTPCTTLLPPIDVLMQLIEKKCAEHITTDGLRFYGTSWAQLSAIFQKFGYVPKAPF